MTKQRSAAIASLTIAAALSTLALAGATQAQTPAPGRPAPPAQAAQRPGAADMQQRMEARRAERKKDLATVLRLRPDQMAALDAFLASQAPPKPGDRPPPPGDGKAMTTPERLDRQAQRTKARDAVRQSRTQGVATFYAALSPDQKQVFDALGRLRTGPDGRGGRGDHKGRGPGMGPGMGQGGGPGMMGPDRRGGMGPMGPRGPGGRGPGGDAPAPR